MFDKVLTVDRSHSLALPRRLLSGWLSVFARIGNYDFCPWANRYVYWLKQPIGWFVLGAVASGMIGAMVAPQGWVVCGTLVVVMAMGVAWPALAMRGLAGELRLDRRRCQEGDTMNLTLVITNRWPWPAWGLLVERGFFAEDDLETGSGGDRPVMALARVPGWTQASYDFEFTPPVRGEYPRQPPELTTGFPFGLWASRRTLPVPHHLLVWPRTTGLAASPQLTGPWSTVAGALVDRAGEEGDVLSVRPYRAGDSLRRVHWIQTAKRDELMVRERQATARRRVVLELDAAAFRDIHQRREFDWAIRVFASLAREMHARACDLSCEISGVAVKVPTTPVALQRLFDQLASLTPPSIPSTARATANSSTQTLISRRSDSVRRVPVGFDVLGELRITISDRSQYASRSAPAKNRRASNGHRFIVLHDGTPHDGEAVSVESVAAQAWCDERPWIELDVAGDVFRQLQRQWERRCHDDWSR